jgi:hypothetical protein
MWCHGTMWLLANNDAEPAMARHDPNDPKLEKSG